MRTGPGAAAIAASFRLSTSGAQPPAAAAGAHDQSPRGATLEPRKPPGANPGRRLKRAATGVLAPTRSDGSARPAAVCCEDLPADLAADGIYGVRYEPSKLRLLRAWEKGCR
jgi:hypothetical protein